jgi:hypothetical protein
MRGSRDHSALQRGGLRRDGNFRFTMAGAGSTAEGQVHEPSQSAEMRVMIGNASSDLMMKLDLIHAKPDSWVKLEIGGTSASSVPGVQQDIKVTYSDYGNATAAQKPPADQVVEAPPEFYNLFN